MVNAMLKLCETAGVKRIFEGDDIQIRELGAGVGGTAEHPTDRKIAGCCWSCRIMTDPTIF